MKKESSENLKIMKNSLKEKERIKGNEKIQNEEISI